MFLISVLLLLATGASAQRKGTIIKDGSTQQLEASPQYGPTIKFQPAPLYADGTVAETDEVIKAKEAHLAAYMAELQHADPNWVEPEPVNQPANRLEQIPIASFGHVPVPKPVRPVQRYFDGFVVERAGPRHPQPVREESEEASQQVYQPRQDYQPRQEYQPRQAYRSQEYNGQEDQRVRPEKYEPAPLNDDGTVADTPEVQEAKAAHLAAYQLIAQLSPATSRPSKEIVYAEESPAQQEHFN